MTRVAVLIVAAGLVATAAGRPPAPSTYPQRAQSRANLGRVAAAVRAYHDAHGRFPADLVDARTKAPLLSWRVAVLPYLDQDFLYAQFRRDEPWDSDHNKRLLGHMPQAFRSPVHGDGPAAETCIQGFVGPGAGFEPGKRLTEADFDDGTTNTLMVAEAGPAVPWTRPADRRYDPKGPLPAMDGPYPDRVLAAFWDGGVRDLSWNMPEQTYRLLVERADGGILPEGALDAPPAPPVTPADQKLVDRYRGLVRDRLKAVEGRAADVRELEAELRRSGGVPAAGGPGPDAGVEEWQAWADELARRDRRLLAEVLRLRRELDRLAERKR